MSNENLKYGMSIQFQAFTPSSKNKYQETRGMRCLLLLLSSSPPELSSVPRTTEGLHIALNWDLSGAILCT